MTDWIEELVALRERAPRGEYKAELDVFDAEERGIEATICNEGGQFLLIGGTDFQPEDAGAWEKAADSPDYRAAQWLAALHNAWPRILPVLLQGKLL